MRASRKILLCALVILIVLLPLWPAFEKTAAPMDEGSLLVYPELILKGQVPYRDFETFYGPANLWVLSAVYAAFSPDIFVERSVGLVYRILILAAIFALTQRWSMTLAVGCTLLAGLLLLPALLPAYAWMGGLMCGLWSIWMIKTPESKWRYSCGGALAGIALLFRPDLGPAVIASALPLLLLKRFANWKFYICGVFVALLPLAWVSFLASPRETLNNLLLFPVIYSSPGRHLAIFSADNYVVCLFFLHIVAAAANVFSGAVAVYLQRSDVRARLLLSLALFGLGLTHQAAQRIDLLHVVYAVLVSVSILPLSIFVVLHLHARTTSSTIRDAVLATAIVVICLATFVPELTFYVRHEVIAALGSGLTKTAFIKEHGRSYPLASDQEVIVLGKMLERIDSVAASGERLFVGPADLRRTNYNDTFIYHLMPHLKPSSYFLEMNPQSANRPNSRLAMDVARADWLLLDHALDVSTEQNESAKFASDQPMRIVSQQFRLCGRYGPWDLYRKKKLASL
jgi:hypothetical protein